MKYINFKRYKFSTSLKALRELIYDFLKFFRVINFKRYDFEKIYKHLNFRRFNFIKVVKNFNPSFYKFNHLKRINIINSKFLLLHLPLAIIFFVFLYIAIPTFYYYDKSNIKNIICQNSKIECLITGKVSYKFYPTPRLKIKKLAINGFNNKKNTIANVEDVAIKLSFKNLLAKEKHKFTKIELNNFKINLDLKNFKEYEDLFSKKKYPIPIIFKKGEIVLYEGNNYVASIIQANLTTKFNQGLINAELKGKFLNDNIYISLIRENLNRKISTELIFKMKNLNFFTKVNFINSKKEKNIIDGNFSVKKGKNKIAGIFDYKNKEFVIKKSNIRNTFIDGKLEGKIMLLPYFVFNLDLNLNSINFTRLYNYFLSFDERKQKDLFKINNKINGKLNLSTEKVYSKHNLIKSLESRLTFYNGNAKIEQLLLNLGKLGAADVLGDINNDKGLSNLKFESNIFVDNQKKFLSKFGIYNKESINSNLFISGNIDLENIKVSFYEISDDKKFNTEDINFIESEFNDLMLEDGFDNMFNFQKLKTFLSSIINEKN